MQEENYIEFDINEQMPFCFVDKNIIDIDSKENPFFAFSLDALSLITEAIDIYFQNGTRYGYDPQEVSRIAALPHKEKMIEIENLVGSFENGPPFTNSDIFMLVVLRELALAALTANEAKEETDNMIPVIEKYLSDNQTSD
jgi:hypothetical protein